MKTGIIFIQDSVNALHVNVNSSCYKRVNKLVVDGQNREIINRTGISGSRKNFMALEKVQ